MRIGLSLSSTRPIGDDAASARSIIERARLANDVGLDSIVLGDRHANTSPYFQNVPMLGRIMAEVDPSRPVGCLFLLPLWHPVLAAEQIATLATMSTSRFIVQTGIGSGESQFAAMGATLQSRGADLDESIRVIKALLAGETVSSTRFGLVDASIAPLPPLPVEWWIGAGVDRALRRAATMGDAWYTSPSFTVAELAKPKQRYEAFCEQVSTNPRTVLRKDVLVLSDGQRAKQTGLELLAAGYRGLGADNVVIGDVAQATEALQSFAAIGVHDVMVRCMSVDDSVAFETIENIGIVRQTLTSAHS